MAKSVEVYVSNLIKLIGLHFDQGIESIVDRTSLSPQDEKHKASLLARISISYGLIGQKRIARYFENKAKQLFEEPME